MVRNNGRHVRAPIAFTLACVGKWTCSKTKLIYPRLSKMIGSMHLRVDLALFTGSGRSSMALTPALVTPTQIWQKVYVVTMG